MIGVIGAGFVGSAVINAFRCPVKVVDPAREDSLKIEDLHDCEGIFVCVPTPMSADGSVDASIVREVVEQIPPNTLTIIKSTVTPDHLTDIHRYRRVVYNPEFLTQRSANEDFLKPDSLIFGGKRGDCVDAFNLYRRYSDVQVCPVFYTDIVTASLVKYALNCHFAAKVTFMNELYQLHQFIAPSSWEDFTRILAADSRLGPTHLQVPGPDGYFGYGGACFPKDTNALLEYARSLGVELSVLRQAVQANEAIRNE